MDRWRCGKAWTIDDAFHHLLLFLPSRNLFGNAVTRAARWEAERGRFFFFLFLLVCPYCSIELSFGRKSGLSHFSCSIVHNIRRISPVLWPFVTHLLFSSLLFSKIYKLFQFWIISFTLSYPFLSLHIRPFLLSHFFLVRLSLFIFLGSNANDWLIVLMSWAETIS